MSIQPWRVTLMIESLRRLAADPAHQLAYLDSLSCDVDELALEFDDIARAAEDMLRCGEIGASQMEYVKHVDQWLERMSDDKSAATWSREALETSDAWARLRLLASGCLKAMGVHDRS